MTYDIKALQVQFDGLLPLLDNTLKYAKDENKSVLSDQDYQRMRIRNANAHLLAQPPEAETIGKRSTPYERFVLGAVAFIDLESAAERLAGEEKVQAREKIDALYRLYDDSGFTDREPLYGYPVSPPRVLKEPVYY